MKEKRWFKILVLINLVVAGCAVAFAVQGYLTGPGSFTATYPATVSSKLNSCGVCHINPGGGGPRNPYGSAFQNNGHSFSAIESIDSDGDGFTNIEEILALTWPGDPSDHPAPSDTTPPIITSFVIPSISSTLTVSITTLTATDANGVTGYFVTESSTAPVAGDAGWTASPPPSYTFSSAGAKTLWAYAKDAAGNVSAGSSASTTITLSDTLPPTITSFVIPSSSSSLIVTINMLAADDNEGVTGYFLRESSTPPMANAPGWTGSPPASYTFSSAGDKTLWAYAKDAADNVSAGVSASTTITLSDSIAPTITSFVIPSNSSSLTVSITSLTATDADGVTGYFVTESASPPSADDPSWTGSPPANYVFSSEGAKTLWAYAKDASGNVSAGASASTTITLSPSVSDMEIWNDTWFKVTINNRNEEQRSRRNIGYLNIRNWVEAEQMLKASLYTTHEGQYSPVDLDLHFTSGTPLGFLSWFDYAGEFVFTVEISGREDGGTLRAARLQAVGMQNTAETEIAEEDGSDDASVDVDEDDHEGEDHEAEDREHHDPEAAEGGENVITIRGFLISLESLPRDILRSLRSDAVRSSKSGN